MKSMYTKLIRLSSCFLFISQTLIASEIIILQAEDNAPDPSIANGSGALQESYNRATKNYHPLLRAEIPKSEYGLNVWARARGVPLQLKAILSSDIKNESEWVWKRPQEWQWVKVGVLEQGDAGNKFEIIGGKNPDEDAGLDAVLLVEDAGYDPNEDYQEEEDKK